MKRFVPIPTISRTRWRHLARHLHVGDGCWIWDGVPSSSGYAQMFFSVDGTRVAPMAHRVVYTWLTGPIASGQVLDHLCRNRLCVRPDHLEVVSEQENILRGEGRAAIQARQTHCHLGHPFTSDNTFITSRGGRGCRLCRKNYMRQYMQRRRSMC